MAGEVGRLSSPEAWEVYNQLWRTYQRFRPQNEHEWTWYAQEHR